MFRYLYLFIYVNISLFHWVYFTSFFDLYIEQISVFIHLEAATWRSATKSCSKSALNELKCACENVLFLLKTQVTNFTKIELLHWYFFKDFDHAISLTLS